MNARVQSIVDNYLSERDCFELARQAASLKFNATLRAALDALLAVEVTAASWETYKAVHAEATKVYRDATAAERAARRDELVDVPRCKPRGSSNRAL